jgi:hypothetical protein
VYLPTAAALTRRYLPWQRHFRIWSKSTRIQRNPRTFGYKELSLVALIIRLIIRIFQLAFLVETVFFSHNKSANSVFQPS